MARQAEAEWKGDLKGGSGRVKLGSGAYEGNYSFATRFENGAGANPEELIGAAHGRLLLDGPGQLARHRPASPPRACTPTPTSTSARTTRAS